MKKTYEKAIFICADFRNKLEILIKENLNIKKINCKTIINFYKNKKKKEKNWEKCRKYAKDKKVDKKGKRCYDNKRNIC